jgi:hypothetical protein
VSHWDNICRIALSWLEKASSRKFLAWVVASVGLFTGYIQSTDWLMVTMLYLGMQTYLDNKKELT